MYRPVKKTLGQSLIELLIALGIAAFVIVALVQSMVTGAKNTRFAKNQTLATRYSQQGIEKVRNLRDTLGWAGFYNTYNGADLCMDQGDPANWTSAPCTANLDNFFIRETTIDDADGLGNRLLINIKTSWTDSDGTHMSEQNTELTRWQ